MNCNLDEVIQISLIPEAVLMTLMTDVLEGPVRRSLEKSSAECLPTPGQPSECPNSPLSHLSLIHNSAHAQKCLGLVHAMPCYSPVKGFTDPGVLAPVYQYSNYDRLFTYALPTLYIPLHDRRDRLLIVHQRRDLPDRVFSR